MNNSIKNTYRIMGIPVFDEQLKQLNASALRWANGESLGFLNNKQYCLSDLEYIVNNAGVELYTILRTQTLTAEFCVKYMLTDESYCVTDMDTYIVDDEILHYQPHLTQEELNNCTKLNDDGEDDK